MFRRVLAREALAAPWRELARVYRRLEARGEIRGGRFVSGMSGEQFALPRAVERLREVRRTPADGRLLTISTADPLNLVGIVTAGERVRAVGAQPPRLSRRRRRSPCAKESSPVICRLPLATVRQRLPSPSVRAGWLPALAGRCRRP